MAESGGGPLRAEWLFLPSDFACRREGNSAQISGAVRTIQRRQDKSVAIVGRFCSVDQWVMALALEGAAGAFWEFTNDINTICASQHCFRAARYWRKLDGKGKTWLSGARM